MNTIQKVDITTDAELTVSNGKLLISEPHRKIIYDKKELLEKSLSKYDNIDYSIVLLYNHEPKTYTIQKISSTDETLSDITKIVNECLTSRTQ